MKKIKQSDEAWDDRLLGADEEFVGVVDEDTDRAIDEAACTQLISIRMQKSLIEDMKLIAELHKIGYQTLMKQILARFADSEKKRLFRALASEKLASEKGESTPDDEGDGKPSKMRKSA